jgi:hypothetical protein
MSKRILICSGLFLAGALIGFEIAWFLGFLRPHADRESPVRPASELVALTLTGTIDGSDRFIFTRDNVVNEHGRWDRPRTCCSTAFRGPIWRSRRRAGSNSPRRWTSPAL